MADQGSRRLSSWPNDKGDDFTSVVVTGNQPWFRLGSFFIRRIHRRTQ